MNVKELKQSIKSNNISNGLYLFKYTDNKWLVDGYIKAIIAITKREPAYISSVEEIKGIEHTEKGLYVLNKDELDELPDRVGENIVIITFKKPKIVCNYIEFPKLEKWQIEDYITSKTEGLSPDNIKYINNYLTKDLYKLDSELSKISLFNTKEKDLVFNLLKKEGNYDNFDSSVVFTLSNFIIQKDVFKLGYLVSKVKGDVFFPLLSILLKQFRNIINVQMGDKETRSKIDPKQLKIIQYNINKYKNEQLVKIYEFLTSIDKDLKFGRLEMDQKTLLDYTVNKILTA